jgi:hypothetical protein
MLGDEVKSYIKKIFIGYSNDKEFKFDVDSTKRIMNSLVLFNKLKDPKGYIAFSLDGSDKYSNIIENLLDDDLLAYIEELIMDRKTNKYDYTLDEMIRVVLACFYRFTMTTSLMGLKLDDIEYGMVRVYVEERYRIKLRYYLIYNILEKKLLDLFLPMSASSSIRVLDFKPDDIISGMVCKLFIENHIDMKYKDHFLMSLRRYMNNEFTISSKACSDMKQGILKTYLQLNLEAK